MESVLSSRLNRIVKAKQQAKRMIELLESTSNDGYHKWAERMRNCSISFCVDFNYYLSSSYEYQDGKKEYFNEWRNYASISNIFYCKVPICPVCCQAKSIKYSYLLASTLPSLLVNYPGCNQIFLTLTQRNCSLFELHNNLRLMQSGWRRFIDRKLLTNLLGYLRKTEINFKFKDDSIIEVHPHQHIIMLFDSSFKKIQNQEIRDMWKQSMNINYNPQCDIRKFNRKGIYEFSKYFFKSSNLLRLLMESNLDIFLKAKKHSRLFTSGGIIRGFLADKIQSIDSKLMSGDEQKHRGLFYDTFSWDFDCNQIIDSQGRIYNPTLIC
jgi:Replication protein